MQQKDQLLTQLCDLALSWMYLQAQWISIVWCAGELLCNDSRRLKFGLSDWQGQSGGQRTALTQLYQATRLVQKSSGDGSSFKIRYVTYLT